MTTIKRQRTISLNRSAPPVKKLYTKKVKPKMQQSPQKFEKTKRVKTKKPTILVTPEDFLRTTQGFLEKSKSKGLIQSFSVTNEPQHLITAEVTINREFIATVRLLFFGLANGNELDQGMQESRNLALLINREVSRESFLIKLSQFLRKRISGISAEVEMFTILENLCKKYPKQLVEIRKATPQEDAFQHADFYLVCKITNKKRVELPIDCKVSDSTKKDSIERYGTGFFFLSLQYIQGTLRLPDGETVLKDFLLENAKSYSKRKAFS